MRARLVVFPIRGRNWCFSRSTDPSVSASATSSQTPSTLKDLWKNISMRDKPLNANAEILVDFVADKVPLIAFSSFLLISFFVLQLCLPLSLAYVHLLLNLVVGGR